WKICAESSYRDPHDPGPGPGGEGAHDLKPSVQRAAQVVRKNSLCMWNESEAGGREEEEEEEEALAQVRQAPQHWYVNNTPASIMRRSSTDETPYRRSPSLDSKPDTPPFTSGFHRFSGEFEYKRPPFAFGFHTTKGSAADVQGALRPGEEVCGVLPGPLLHIPPRTAALQDGRGLHDGPAIWNGLLQPPFLEAQCARVRIVCAQQKEAIPSKRDIRWPAMGVTKTPVVGYVEPLFGGTGWRGCPAVLCIL
ncbi:hypothetical protein L3Q82_008601, partial [Scortum barcoo]